MFEFDWEIIEDMFSNCSEEEIEEYLMDID